MEKIIYKGKTQQEWEPGLGKEQTEILFNFLNRLKTEKCYIQYRSGTIYKIKESQAFFNYIWDNLLTIIVNYQTFLSNKKSSRIFLRVPVIDILYDEFISLFIQIIKKDDIKSKWELGNVALLYSCSNNPICEFGTKKLNNVNKLTETK